MVKTCELQTCDGLHTVELQDILFSPDSQTIKRVSGETILTLPIDLNSIDQRLKTIETLMHSITDESVYSEIKIELNAIRDLINQVEADFQNINSEFLSVQNLVNNLSDSSLDRDSFNEFVNAYNNWKNSIQSQVNINTANISTLKTDVSNNTTELQNLKTDYNEFKNTINSEIDTINQKIQENANAINKLLSNSELETGGLTFKNVNGKTIIKFNSSVNYGSDYGYIEYDDDNNTYNFWGDSQENSALIIGVENDGQNMVSDVVVLKSPAAIVVDSPDIIMKTDTTHYSLLSKLGLGTPDYNSGWFSVSRDTGASLTNPLGQNAFFIGYIKFTNGDIMQFGVYSGYDDDDNVDGGDTGVYLVIQASKLIVAVRKHNNDGTPSAVGLSDGITYSTPVQNTFDCKIIGWKLPDGVVL
jgi:predicted  nucleic acid-binding Zn-ribbon protein